MESATIWALKTTNFKEIILFFSCMLILDVYGKKGYTYSVVLDVLKEMNEIM